MKKTAALLFLLLSLIFLPGWDEEERDYTIERLDIRAYILEDGDLYVEELYTYDFKGEFNGTTRSIKNNGHDGVEFFEAYVPPRGKSLGEFSFKNSQRLKTKLDEETFYVYTASNNEKKRVYYRYRLKNAVRKYKDTAEFYWAFFDYSNESDLHQVTIDVILPKPFKKDQMQYFLHERMDGRFTGSTDYSIRYQNPLLPAYSTSEIRLLFPSNFLPKADLTSDKNMKAEILAEEEKFQERFAAREKLLDIAESVANFLSLLLIFAIMLYILLKILRCGIIRGETSEAERLEELDPLFVAFVYRKGKLKPRDLTAGLFSLYQRGIISIEKTKGDFKFLWTGKTQDLEKHERYLIDSLFIDREKTWEKTYRTCTLASIARRLSKNTFRQWKEKVLTHKPFVPYIRESKFLKYLIRCLLPIHFGMSIYLYYADVVSMRNIVLAGVVLGTAAWISALKYQRKRRFILFLVISFFALVGLLEESDALNAYTNFIFLSILPMVVVPVFSPTFKGAIYRFAIKSWHKALDNGTYPVGSGPEQREHLMQYALVLGVSDSFARHYGEVGRYRDLEKNLPLITKPRETAATFTSAHISWNRSSGSGFSGGGGSSGGSGGGGGAGAF